jgi:hypothetical protein
VQLDRPFRIVTPTVDGEALAVLAGADAEFTAPQVQAVIGRYSVEGVRRALGRLTGQGIVIARRPTRTALYRLNRAHLGADPIIAIATIRTRLISELQRRFEQWDPSPDFAALFGSAASNRMRVDSDIDLFVTRPRAIDPDLSAWRDQVDSLTHAVTSWTGNDARLLEYDTTDVSKGQAIGDPLLRQVRDEGLVLYGPPSFLRRPRATG